MKTSISQKETSPLAHFVRNSLPHKSFRFCSPMRNIWNQQLEPANGNQQMKPANGNHQIAKRNFPSCSLRSQFTASQKLPLLFPNAPLVTTNGLYLDDLQANHLNPTRSQHTKPVTGSHYLFVYLRSFGPSSLKRLFPPSPRFSALCASSIPCSVCK